MRYNRIPAVVPGDNEGSSNPWPETSFSPMDT